MHAEWQNVSTFSDLQACDNVVFRIGRRSSMRNGELYRTTESFHDVDGTPRRQGPSKSVLRRIGGFFSDIHHLRLDPVGSGTGGKRDDDRDLRARTVVHGDRSARRAARHHARLRTHDQKAPRGVSVRRRHRAHRSRNDCHATAARAKSRAQAPHRPACAAATAARSTATGRLRRPAASSSRPSTLVGSGERKESSLRPLERLEGPRELIRRARQWARGAASQHG